MAGSSPEPFELVVRGQLVLPEGEIREGDLRITGGRIAAVAARGEMVAAEVVDAGTSLVLLGMVDVHVTPEARRPRESAARPGPPPPGA